MKSISCIIPAYNEARRVTNVVEVVLKNQYIDQIIVINDGSSDKTEEVLKGIQGIELISYAKNGGKSHAVMLGFKVARNQLVLMLDSDLIGLNQENINSLVEPVIQGKADTSMSLRNNSLGFYKFMGMDFVSGERCFNKDIIKNLDELDTIPGYALETFLNRIFIGKKMKIKVVSWPNVSIVNKSAKLGKLAGLKGEFKMVRELIRFAGLIGIFTIFIKMLALRVDD